MKGVPGRPGVLGPEHHVPLGLPVGKRALPSDLLHAPGDALYCVTQSHAALDATTNVQEK